MLSSSYEPQGTGIPTGKHHTAYVSLARVMIVGALPRHSRGISEFKAWSEETASHEISKDRRRRHGAVKPYTSSTQTLRPKPTALKDSHTYFHQDADVWRFVRKPKTRKGERRRPGRGRGWWNFCDRLGHHRHDLQLTTSSSETFAATAVVGYRLP